MNAHFKLDPEAVGTADVASKASIFERLADCFAAVYSLDRADVLSGLQAREAIGSTGFGRGVAIPHARVAGVGRPVAAFLRLKSPVDFDAADGSPVDLVFGLLSPEHAGVSHLHALAAISRMMREDGMRRALSEAPGPEALFSLLSNVVDRDAA